MTPVDDNGGQVKYYQLIVAEGHHPSLQDAPLHNYQTAEAEGHGYWIAAQVSPQYLVSRTGEISLGDNQLYGGYLNHGPLSGVQGYGVAVAVSQSLNGESRTSVSDLVQADQTSDNIIKRVRNDENGYYNKIRASSSSSRPASSTSSTVTIALIVGVVVGAVLLVIAIVIFVVLRRKVGSPLRRARSDTQELTAHQQQQQQQKTSAAYAQEQDEILASELDLNVIKAKVWMIPKNFVELSHEVLGRGKFGSVLKGQVQTSGRVIWCNTQHVQLSALTRDQHVDLLRNLETAICAGKISSSSLKIFTLKAKSSCLSDR